MQTKFGAEELRPKEGKKGLIFANERDKSGDSRKVRAERTSKSTKKRRNPDYLNAGTFEVERKKAAAFDKRAPGRREMHEEFGGAGKTVSGP